MKKVFVLILILSSITANAQVFYQQSFETLDGWTLSHVFDDGNDVYSKRDSAIALLELGYTLSGHEGHFVIAAERSDDLDGESPTDGVLELEIESVDISGYSNLEMVVKLSCNADDMSYDDRALANGDYVDFQVKIDGADWTTIGQFNSREGGSAISTLYQDTDMDGNGGELGELPVGNGMSNFVMPIGGTGSSLESRVVYNMDGSDEVIVIDDLRLRESQGDDTPPSVYSTEVVDQNTLSLVFQEPMSAASANQTFHYAGISGLSTATLQADNHTVVLDYSSDFELGEPYTLVVFSVEDLAGNQMATAHTFSFYYNPTTPDLVITEVMYNDPSVEDTLEFIEIYNNGIEDAIVGGFRLEEAVNHTFASVTIPPGGFYLVARNAVAAESFYGNSFEDYGGMLSDNSEEIVLVNVNGVLLDSVPYNDNVPWPSAADGTGPSMELIGPDFDNAIGNNWVASTNGLGTINGMPLSASPGILMTLATPVVQFDNNDISVNESDGLIQFEIYIAASNSNQSVIQLDITAGNASTDDHGVTVGSLNLPANSDGLELVAFPLTNDALLEGLEYFTVSMSAQSNCEIGLNNEITVIIADDEYESPALFVNEVQSSNSATIQDEFADYDDWIEIYNPNSEAVNIAGYYISDDEGNPLKDRFAIDDNSTILAPMSYTLLWADEEGEQGPLHMNFKLSASGEAVVLTGPDGIELVDELIFPEIPSDNSYARICDGQEPLDIQAVPTPASSNCPNGLEELNYPLVIYPNPTSDYIQLPELMSYRIYNELAQEIMNGKAQRLDVSGLPKGVYHLVSTDGGHVTFIKK